MYCAGGEGVHLHGEQRTANEIGLLRLAGPDGDVGGAHGNGDLLVVEHQLDADIGVQLEELAQRCVTHTVPRPIGVVMRRSPEGFGRGVGEERLRRRELAHDLAGGAEQHLALLGQHRGRARGGGTGKLQLLFQGRYLTADRRLAHAQRFTGMGEAAGLGGGMEDAEFVPVHGRGFSIDGW
jgi:hypothetical protein